MKIPRPKIIITMGDPAGVGPESVVRSLQILKKKNVPPAAFTVIGSKKILLKIPGASGILSAVELIDLDNVSEKQWKWGSIGRYSGQAAREYLDTALALLKQDRRSILVTAPVSKEAVQATGIPFHGHTEYFASMTGTKEFLMLFKGSRLFLSVLTRHVPLSTVPRLLGDTDGIKSSLFLTYLACKKLKGIDRPRIGICGFNPHAGIDTFLGKEERSLIRAIKHVSCKKYIQGPYPADSLLKKAYEGSYDAVVCTYHDQAMIPFKMLDSDQGINITYGLPFIRLSPVYGTAKDIAGKGTVHCASMVSALRFALQQQRTGHHKRPY